MKSYDRFARSSLALICSWGCLLAISPVVGIVVGDWFKESIDSSIKIGSIPIFYSLEELVPILVLCSSLVDGFPFVGSKLDVIFSSFT